MIHSSRVGIDFYFFKYVYVSNSLFIYFVSIYDSFF